MPEAPKRKRNVLRNSILERIKELALEQERNIQLRDELLRILEGNPAEDNTQEDELPL